MAVLDQHSPKQSTQNNEHKQFWCTYCGDDLPPGINRGPSRYCSRACLETDYSEAVRLGYVRLARKLRETIRLRDAAAKHRKQRLEVLP